MEPLIGMMLGGAIGQGVGGLASLFGGDAGEAEMRQAFALIEAVQDPQFDFRQLTPPQLDFIAQVDPVTYSARVPDDVKLMAESPARANQLKALSGMEAIAERGMPLADQLAAQSAVEQIARSAGGQQNAVMQNLAARGRTGGGMEVAARMEGDRGLNQLRGDMGRGLLEEALQRRFDALESSGAMAGDVRAGDALRESENSRMINNMHQFIAGLETQAERDNAATMMQNSVREAEGRQGVQNANELARADVDQANLDRYNAGHQAISNFQLGRAQAGAEALGGIAQSQRAQDAALQRGATNTMGATGMLGGYLAAGTGGGSGASTPNPGLFSSGPTQSYDWMTGKPMQSTRPAISWFGS